MFGQFYITINQPIRVIKNRLKYAITSRTDFTQRNYNEVVYTEGFELWANSTFVGPNIPFMAFGTFSKLNGKTFIRMDCRLSWFALIPILVIGLGAFSLFLILLITEPGNICVALFSLLISIFIFMPGFIAFAVSERELKEFLHKTLNEVIPSIIK